MQIGFTASYSGKGPYHAALVDANGRTYVRKAYPFSTKEGAIDRSNEILRHMSGTMESVREIAGFKPE